MKHPNIVPVKFVDIERFMLVSEWMESGNILEFLRTYPDADRLNLVGSFSVCRIARSPFISCLVLPKAFPTSILLT